MHNHSSCAIKYRRFPIISTEILALGSSTEFSISNTTNFAKPPFPLLLLILISNFVYFLTQYSCGMNIEWERLLKNTFWVKKSTIYERASSSFFTKRSRPRFWQFDISKSSSRLKYEWKIWIRRVAQVLKLGLGENSSSVLQGGDVTSSLPPSSTKVWHFENYSHSCL